MLDQQIESISNKLVQFIQELTINFQTIYNKKNFNENFIELFQLRSDYSKQLASLFDMLINRFIDEYLINRNIQIILNLDPVQIWRSIQDSIDQLNDMQWQDLYLIIKHIRTINNHFYNLLLQLKNAEFLKIDQIRILYINLIEELNHLSKSLIHFTTIFCTNSQKNTNTKLDESSKPLDTYLFQSGIITPQYSNNNNNHHINEKSNLPPAMNSNCYPCNISFQQPYCSNIGRGFCFQPNPIRCTTGTIPTANVFSYCKPMGCGTGSAKIDVPPPLCFPTPVVYTPEMEKLFLSGGIIYARKSGNTWIAENLGTLIETLKDIGETIDMNEHCEILVRKTGDLFVRRKRGRRKRFLQQNINKITPNGNNTYDEMNMNNEQSDSNRSNNNNNNDD